jgi:hypothetical protein
MKRYIVTALVILALVGSTTRAQFKTQIEQESRVSNSIYQQPEETSLFGWFNPEKFHMHHSLSFSYQTMGGQGVSLGTYTNSMMYEFANNLNARADVSLSYSPFASSSFMSKGMNNSLSSIYLSRAEVNYKPWENVTVQFQYRQLPYGSYYSPFASPWFGGDGY